MFVQDSLVEGLAELLYAQNELEILKLKRLHSLNTSDAIEGKICSTKLSEISFAHCDFINQTSYSFPLVPFPME